MTGSMKSKIKPLRENRENEKEKTGTDHDAAAGD